MSLAAIIPTWSNDPPPPESMTERRSIIDGFYRAVHRAAVLGPKLYALPTRSEAVNGDIRLISQAQMMQPRIREYVDAAIADARRLGLWKSEWPESAQQLEQAAANEGLGLAPLIWVAIIAILAIVGGGAMYALMRQFTELLKAVKGVLETPAGAIGTLVVIGVAAWFLFSRYRRRRTERVYE